MSQNLLFDIKIPEGHFVQFEQESTFENFIGQFQEICPKLLCVVDGTCLRYYDKPGTLPTNVRFDYKQRRGKITEYYFRDIENDSLYCVFGREAAKIFYPRIDEVDCINGKSQVNELIAPSSNYINNGNLTTICDNKKSGERTHEMKSQLAYGNATKNSVYKNEIEKSPKGLGAQSYNNSHTVKRTIIQTVKKDNKRTNVSMRQGHNSSGESSVANKSRKPNQIVIIDKGVKLIFPDSNYPVEVRTHYPE